jgi:hypothetical protein
MSKRRTLGVLFLLLTFAVPDLLACGDKFLLAGRFTRYQRPKGARDASVLIYVDPARVKKTDIEKVLTLGRHHFAKVQTLQELSTVVSNGHYDVILTTKAEMASVQKLTQGSPDAASALPIDDVVKNFSLLKEIDKVVVQRDQNRKKK